MNRKIFCLALSAILFALTHPLEAQQPPKKVARIGVLRNDSPSTFASRNQAFRQGLRELGYVEGENIQLEYRYADTKLDRLPQLAAELVRQKVDVIVVGGSGATRAAKQVTGRIPIVVGSAGDLVGAGLVASLSKPGGNITGSTDISPDVSGKRLELIREVIPNSSRVAVVFYGNEGDWDEVRATEIAARPLDVKVQRTKVSERNEFDNAFARMTKQQSHAAIFIQGTGIFFHRKELMELALKYRLPTMCETSLWTEDGCLMNYGPDLFYLWRRAATYVDKILKGAKPADLPVEQPTKFELVINLKTAKQIGVTIPPGVLARADKVIR
jgi:putative ABC transport system substrate-binding protein